MDVDKARPIIGFEGYEPVPNEAHLVWAVEVIRYVDKCFRNYSGEINPELRIFGMEKYEDFVNQAPFVLNALSQLDEIVKFGNMRRLVKIARDERTKAQRQAEADAEIIARTFPLV